MTKQLLHLVFGGELTDPADVEFADLSKIDVGRHLSQFCRG